MIENSGNELRGQVEFTDFLPKEQGTGTPEGYDAEGRLLNEDWPEVGEATGTSSDPAKAGPPSPPGEGLECGPDCCDIEDPQTPADGGTGEATSSDPPEAGYIPLKGKGFGGTVTLSNIDARLRTLAGEIQAITEHARVVLASAAIDIGKRLIEARGMLPEGRWYEWLEKNVDYSVRQAQVMMQLAEQFGRGELPEAFRGLGISHMTALLAAPAEEREDLAKRVQDDGLSVRELKKEIEALKIEKVKGQMRIEALKDQYEMAKRNIEEMTEEDQKQARAIVERDEQLKAATTAIEKEREAVRLANAKAAAAEASAEELRRLHSDAEDRAAASAQRASDAVNRANQAAKDLAEARAKIAAMEEEMKAAVAGETTGTSSDPASRATFPKGEGTGEVPESVQKELDDLRAQLAEARAAREMTGTSSAPDGAPVHGPAGPVSLETAHSAVSRALDAPEGKAFEGTAIDRFKTFYTGQMKPVFKTALELLREVSKEDGKAADMFATALVNGCKQLMNQIGEGAGT